MKKTLIMALISCTLYAEDFEHFLSSAIKNSPYLKASTLQIEQSEAAGSALTRYKNPVLELEVSYFDEQNDGDTGFRAAYVQPIRLWGVGDNRESLAAANVALAEANYRQLRAAFERDISLQYTQYAQSDLLLTLASEELSIAQTIYTIAQARYEAGTTSRGEMLQARVDYKMARSRVNSVEILQQRNYYELLKNAGINDEITLDTGHTFVYKNTVMKNPELQQLQQTQKSAAAEAALNTNKVEWMSLVAEYEKEPLQDIFRFGTVIPLAFFNTKHQEKRIATLEASKAEMLNENATNQLAIEQKRLAYEAEALLRLKSIDQEIQQDQQELLTMFEEGYKLTNINLLALQDIKARLIKTKELLIKIKIELDRNAIIQNYLQGNYNADS